MIDVLTFGETMVSFRAEGVLTSGAECTAHVAGAESNVAIALARLGHRARWVGAVSEDALGDLVASTLRGQGVDIIAADPQGRPSGVMLLQRRTADLSQVTYVRRDSAGSRLTREAVLSALAEGARRLHVSGITPALSPSTREATLTAVVEAADRGISVSLDVNYRGALWTRKEARAALMELVPHVDLVIASEDELDLVAEAGRTEAELLTALDAMGCGEVVVKRGARGATLHRAGRAIDAPARSVTVRDVVGAGDAFTAGYLSGRLDGLTDEGCLSRGLTLGAFVVSTLGDWEGLPGRHELHLLGDGPLTDVTR